MFLPDITINTNVYSLQSQRTLSSVRSDSARSVSEPKLLTISHEIIKSGRIATAVMVDDTKIVSLPGAVVPTSDTVRAFVKIQYNPLMGRLTLEADIAAAIADVVAFLSDPTYVDKLLNRES